MFDKAFRQRGIQQMIFTSVEAEENDVSGLFGSPQRERLHGSSTD